jgi:hypothetical protein
MAIDKKLMEDIASKLAMYKEGANKLEETSQLYNGFVETLEGSITVYNNTLNPKTHNPLGIIGLYQDREKLRSVANEVISKIGKGITCKVGNAEYKIDKKDFANVKTFLEEADKNIGYLYKMYSLQIDAVAGTIGEMKSKYNGKN